MPFIVRCDCWRTPAWADQVLFGAKLTSVGPDMAIGRSSRQRQSHNVNVTATSKEYRASNGIIFRIEGEGEPLLLLHGLMATGTMFEPLVELLRDRFCMLIPDLRGHGNSGDLDGPYDVAALTADLDIVLAEARFDRSAVMGYSHGGAVSATTGACSAGSGYQTDAGVHLRLQRLNAERTPRSQCAINASAILQPR